MPVRIPESGNSLAQELALPLGRVRQVHPMADACAGQDWEPHGYCSCTPPCVIALIEGQSYICHSPQVPQVLWRMLFHFQWKKDSTFNTVNFCMWNREGRSHLVLCLREQNVIGWLHLTSGQTIIK